MSNSKKIDKQLKKEFPFVSLTDDDVLEQIQIVKEEIGKCVLDRRFGNYLIDVGQTLTQLETEWAMRTIRH